MFLEPSDKKNGQVFSLTKRTANPKREYIYFKMIMKPETRIPFVSNQDLVLISEIPSRLESNKG